MKKILAEIDRRNLFRYLGNSALCYPFMRTLLETQAFGAGNSKRALFYYYPTGVVGEYFHPKATGSNFEMPLTLAPMKALKDDIVVLNNINFAGPNGHDEGSFYCLTGGIKNVSLDNYLGDQFKAVQRSVYHGVSSGKFMGSGSQISYQSTDSSKPIGQQSAVARSIEDNPRKAFENLFNAPPGGGSGESSVVDSKKYGKSVLDYCLEETKSLQNKIGTLEKQKLDLHLASIRELERQIQATPNMPSGAACSKDVDFKGLENPEKDAINYYQDDKNYRAVGDVMIELTVQALACGVTNVAFLQFSHAQSPTNMGPTLGAEFAVGQHEVSHHNYNADSMLYFARMQVYFFEQYAKLISRLKSIPEGDKTLLYNTISLAFSEMGDPAQHENSRLGLILAGQAGGRLKTGQVVDALTRSSGMTIIKAANDAERRAREKAGMSGGTGVDGVCYNHVLITILQAMGLKDETFGNASYGKGPIPGLLT